jgi:hypothetical protein
MLIKVPLDIVIRPADEASHDPLSSELYSKVVRTALRKLGSDHQATPIRASPSINA